MSLSRILVLLKKDFALGPRSPIFLYALILPAVLTLVFQVAFGQLFAPEPRLGVVDRGSSEVVRRLEELDGIELAVLDDEAELRRQVEANDLDAGMVLPQGFDSEVRAGQQPPLDFFIGGESYAANRIILSVSAIDALRDLEGSESPVDVRVVNFGDEGLPISTRLIPVIIFYALVMAGVFLPGSSIVEEKEKGTLMALLVTPARASEVLFSKWFFGTSLALALSVMTLLLNRAFGNRPLDVLVVLLVASAMTAMLGLLAGVVAKNSTVLFGLLKGTGWFLFMPAFFYLFPDWPQWIAKLFPLYWIMEPIWQVSIMGHPIGTVWVELAVAVAITIALVPLTIWLARRMRAQMAAG
jgi:ABC-2 type transport system permease protein